MFLEPSLLQAEPQLSQPSFIEEVFHPSGHFCSPPLDVLQQVHVFVVLKAPELDAGLQVRSHQSRVADHLSQCAGHASFDAAQDMVVLGCEGTLRAYVQRFIHPYSQVLLNRAALNPFVHQPVLTLIVTPTKVQDPTLGFVEPVRDLEFTLFPRQMLMRLGLLCVYCERLIYFFQALRTLTGFITLAQAPVVPPSTLPIVQDPISVQPRTISPCPRVVV